MAPIVLAISTPAAAAITVTAGASAAPVAVPVWLEMVAIIVSSISGVLSAREQKLDIVGAVGLAVACSLGGGLLRDTILQVGDVYIFNQPAALPAAIATAAVAFIIPSVLEKQDRIIAILDIFAVGLYTATGADKALVYGFDPVICIMMGFFTGVGGGMLRDIFLGKTPSIFQRGNLYAIASIAGAVVYLTAVALDLSHVLGVVACVMVTMIIRWASLKFNIMSPVDMDLTQMVNHRRPRAGEGAMRPRIDRSDLSTAELAERRERTLADIEERRRQERRREALTRLKRHRQKRRQRKLDI